MSLGSSSPVDCVWSGRRFGSRSPRHSAMTKERREEFMGESLNVEAIKRSSQKEAIGKLSIIRFNLPGRAFRFAECDRCRRNSSPP